MTVLSCALCLALAATPLDGGVDAGWRGFSPDVEAALQRVVEEERSVGPHAGLAVAVVRDDLEWRSTTGAAVLKPLTETTPETSFRIASITKTFTAALTMRLVERGALSLDDDVRTWVPGFPEKAGVVTVRTLLNHTSGIGHYTSARDGHTTTPFTTAQALALFSSRPLLAAPGKQFVYSSYGYVLLGAVVEKAAHQPFGVLLRDELLDPLELHATGLEADAATRANRATGYSVGARALMAAAPLDISSRFSSGGMRSTLEDLVRWARAWLGGKVVSDASWRAMTTPATTSEGFSPDYGLGFAVYPQRGRKVVAHAGGQSGATSLLLLVPEERFAVVILSNVTARGPVLNRLATRLLEVVLDDGLPVRALASSSRADEVRADALTRAMSHGVVAWRGEPAAADARTAEAFAWFDAQLSSETLKTDPAAVEAALRSAYQPASGRRSVLLGAEVARVLAQRGGDAAVRAAVRAGPLQFFADYVEACAKTPCAHPLPARFAAHVARLNTAWRAVPEPLRLLRAEELLGADEVLTQLQALEGATVHPDFVEELTRAAMRARARGDAEEATRLLAASARWHPNSALAALAVAEDAAVRGEREAADAALQRAFTLRPALFNAEFLKVRGETMRFGLTASGAAALNGLYAQARTWAKRAPPKLAH